ncbi:hypothetical protein CRE_30364 [Caenorhabditis remanei]|uniref:Inhibitor of growth protein N-terminal histone-binding domain-containing protein n=1 Tax=Caenorhabditis remanei TaxID=31234 RepID=E3N602_CAERE|nr:hypothetical protein CRE_30364 [Caenorhabditis remanei]
MEMNEGVQKIIEIFQKINTEAPPKTREALDEIGRLDALAKEQSDQVQNLKVQFLANFDKMTTEQKSNAFSHLQLQMEKMLEYSDQKVEISRRMTANLTEMKSQFDAASTNFIENYPTSSHRNSEANRTPETPKTSSSNRKKNETPDEKRRGRKKKEVKKEEEGEDIKQEELDDGNGEILNEMLDEDDEDRTWCW